MGFLNRVILTGRLTADPELKYTENEVAITRFRVATERIPKKNGEKVTDFINIVTFNGQAKACAEYLKKGHMIAIDGKLQTSTYEKNGERQYYTNVVADNLHWVDPKTFETREASAVAA